MMESRNEEAQGRHREEDAETDDGHLSPEAVAFIYDLGICTGRACPRSEGGCDPCCPALRAWVEEVSGG